MSLRSTLATSALLAAAAVAAGVAARAVPLPESLASRPRAGGASRGALAIFGDAGSDDAGVTRSAVSARAAGAAAAVGRAARRAAASATSAEARGGDASGVDGTVRHTLAAGARGTYLAELLADRDSSLARWPERVDRPLEVWVQPSPAVAGWRPEFADRAREAFAEWSGTGIPLRFTFVEDSARADVHLTWIDRFAEPISGKTFWARDDHWWIVSADVVLALHHHDGSPLDGSAVRAIALHEIGHLVGLDHTADPANIMAPRVRVRALSPADGATARLLYSVPAGRVR